MKGEKMNKKNGVRIDIVRAWKDPSYRKSLTPLEVLSLPPNPAGDKEILTEELQMIVRSWVEFLWDGCDSGPYTDHVTYWSCHCDVRVLKVE
jgi:mersacidin/lichenicidin family type 2 lantibiotic